MWSLQARSGPMLMLSAHMTINKKEWIIALGGNLHVFMYLRSACWRVRPSVLVWMRACRDTDSWHSGRHLLNNTARQAEENIIELKSAAGWTSSRMNSTQRARCHTYVPTGGFRLTGFRSGFALLLQLLGEATRASPRHDHTQSVIMAWGVMSNFKAHQQSSKANETQRFQAFSPVLAGFLLSSCFSTRGGSEWSWVGLLQVLIIQESIWIHQVLHRDTGTSL